MAIIQNIRQLKGAAVLADRTAQTADLQFRRFNLLYGFNGSGKSTLSRLFASLQQGKKVDKLPDCTFEFEMDDKTRFACPKSLAGLEKRVCVFNGDFVAENFRWEEGEANPVFYIGADQTEAKAKLDGLEKTLPAAIAKIESQAAIVKEREKGFGTYKKERARSIAERIKSGSRYEAQQLQADYDKLGFDAKNILSDTDLDAATATCARSEPPPKVQPVNVPADGTLAAITAAAEMAPKTVGSVVIEGLTNHPTMVPWVCVRKAWFSTARNI
jgi:wobble nucleotide-excising tRNase